MGPAEVIPLRCAPTALPALLRSTVETMRQQAEALDATLTVEADSDLPLVRVDPDKIAWAVATLVGNSLRYIRRGTRRLPGGTITVRIGVEDGGIVIAVEDDGAGIPPEKVAHLLHRAPGVVHGAGLGLLLIQDVVAAHGGTVTVQSKHGGLESGTVVLLGLPNDRAIAAGS
jgi:signal transduction histidine kinase